MAEGYRQAASVIFVDEFRGQIGKLSPELFLPSYSPAEYRARNSFALSRIACANRTCDVCGMDHGISFLLNQLEPRFDAELMNSGG